MKPLAGLLARLAVRRPATLIAAVAVLIAASLFVLRTKQSFDSEILNLLPAGTPAVEGLKIYNSRFNSARELAFLIETPDEAIASDFVEALRQQPWALRVLDSPPTESAEGRETLPDLIGPLVLGQNEEAFDQTLTHLEPDRISARIAQLASRVAAGSPLARLELQNDPLGIVAPTAAEIASKLSVSEAFDLVAGETQLIPVITSQPDLSADSCRNLMRDVHAFVKTFRQTAGTNPPTISVTGRSAYVDEISQSMQRDIAATSLASLLAVTLLFWLSFRSLLPLVGSVLILALTCLVSLAAGSLLFDKLNIVAMGFCSILVGLGDDFSLLLYQRYLGARASGKAREAAIRDAISVSAPGILWVAVSTGLGFAALVFSGSAAFGQLGILIAIGVFTSAIGMICLMPLFQREPRIRTSADPVLSFCRGFLTPPILPLASAVLATSVLIAFIPWRTLSFDTSTHSLEPKNIPAAQALSRILEKFPAAFEPVMVVVQEPESLPALDAKLEDLRERGLIRSFSSPSPLVTNAENTERNRARLAALDLEGVESAITAAERAANLAPGALDSGVRLLRAMQSGDSLVHRLPPTSPWWFVLDRSISPESQHVIYYLRLDPGASSEHRQALEEEILSVAPNVLVTGWSQMLHDLVPWATRELLVFGSLVVVIILAVLLATYRDIRPLLLHAATLAFALCGTVATLKLANQQINLLNVLAFPLILAVGVDYGVHLVLASREPGNAIANLQAVMKPVLISGLTTVTGFGALMLASNPALSGLGLVCATGVAWCLFASLCFLAPLSIRWIPTRRHSDDS